MKKVEKVLLSIFVPMFFGLIAAVSACSISPATYTVNYYAEDKTLFFLQPLFLKKMRLFSTLFQLKNLTNILIISLIIG